MQEPAVLLCFAAQRKGGYITLDDCSAGAGEDPVRLDVRVAVGSCCKCCAEQGGPGIVVVGAQGSGAVLLRNVLSDCMPFAAVHTTLALLEVYRVAGEVPVDDGVPVGVEVQTFLADGRLTTPCRTRLARDRQRHPGKRCHLPGTGARKCQAQDDKRPSPRSHEWVPC